MAQILAAKNKLGLGAAKKNVGFSAFQKQEETKAPPAAYVESSFADPFDKPNFDMNATIP